MKIRDSFNQKKYFWGETIAQTKICNHTNCDFNDFGKCMTIPAIDKYGSVYVCKTFSVEETKRAQKELAEGVF
jgi:hypothetical protein